jgi:excisionase family DNA binding protein
VDRIALSVREAAEAASLGRSTLYAAIATGALPARRVGARRIILVDDLRSWLEAQEPVAPTAAARLH